MTGTQINESKLATVPSAANATNAGNANTVGGVTAAALKLSCPPGTTPFSGVCFETTVRADQALQGAMQTCAAAGRVLPSN